MNRIYYGWVMIIVAAVLMAATLPGRTHGVGLITTRLLEETELSNICFAYINFGATIIGSLFCLPCGILLDKFGARVLSGIVLTCLGLSVIGLSRSMSSETVALTLLLTRSFGQSMLSIISLTIIAKWFQRRLDVAMGIYAVLMSLLLATVTGVMGGAVAEFGWRTAWEWQGFGLLGASVLVLIVARNQPHQRSTEFDNPAMKKQENAPSQGTFEDEPHATLAMALSTRCFWIFTLSISFFGLVSSGLSLFNQFVLEERGFGESVFHNTLVIGLLSGMIANLFTGWCAKRIRHQYLLSGGLFILGLSLLAFPFLRTEGQVYAYAIFFGIAGGILTVLFFSVWGHAFGRRYVGQIQAAAQMVTVLASALGPVAVSVCQNYTGSYLHIFVGCSIISLFMAVGALVTRVPDVQRDYRKVELNPYSDTEANACPAI